MLIAIGVAVLTLGGACQGTGTERPSPGGREPAGGGSTTIDRVTVSGTISRMLSDRAFLLTDATVEQGEATVRPDLPVVVTGTPTDVSTDERVTVTGTLDEAVLGDQLRALADRIGLQVDDRVIRYLEGRQLLVASSVQPA